MKKLTIKELKKLLYPHGCQYEYDRLTAIINHIPKGDIDQSPVTWWENEFKK